MNRGNKGVAGGAAAYRVRDELSEAWRPRDALEQLLVDQLAVYQVQLWHWQETFYVYSEVADFARRKVEEKGVHDRPRVTDLEATETAATLADRFQGLFLKTLRALQSLRRPGPVVVRRAGQVNVAHQQLNIAE
jgi:hypothetical protein